jgi:hypothetical protein
VNLWAKRAAQVRAAAEAAEEARLPGYAARQERNEYLELAYEGQRSDRRAREERKRVEAAGKAAVDVWSDSDESANLMGEVKCS